MTIVRDIRFLDMLHVLMGERTRNKEGRYILRLRETGVCWCFGTVESMFEENEGVRTLPGGPMLPSQLESEDEMVFEIVD